MDDAYGRLGMERALVIEDAVLREVFDRVGGAEHPDAGGEREAFARVREAYETLRSPGKRLRHWLETAGVAWEAGGSVPAVLMELFGVVGELLQRADGLVGRKLVAQSALGRSMLEREGMGLMEELEAAMSEVGGMREDLVGRFGEFEVLGVDGCAGEAQEVARTLMFLEKWEAQLRERWAGLAG